MKCIKISLCAISLVLVSQVYAESPWINVTAAEYDLGEHTEIKLDPNESIKSGSTHQAESYDLAYRVSRTPYCAKATVTDVRYECIGRPHTGVNSLAIVQFQVDELYWGEKGETVIFETIVSRVEDCRVFYDTPQHHGFELGEEFLVLGANGHQTNYIRRFGLLRLVDGQLTAENGQSWSMKYAIELVELRQKSDSEKIQDGQTE